MEEFIAEVSHIQDLTHDVRAIELRLLEPSDIMFKAGQFVSFEMPKEESSSCDETLFRGLATQSGRSHSSDPQSGPGGPRFELPLQLAGRFSNLVQRAGRIVLFARRWLKRPVVRRHGNRHRSIPQHDLGSTGAWGVTIRDLVLGASQPAGSISTGGAAGTGSCLSSSFPT